MEKYAHLEGGGSKFCPTPLAAGKILELRALTAAGWIAEAPPVISDVHCANLPQLTRDPAPYDAAGSTLGWGRTWTTRLGVRLSIIAGWRHTSARCSTWNGQTLSATSWNGLLPGMTSWRPNSRCRDPRDRRPTRVGTAERPTLRRRCLPPNSGSKTAEPLAIGDPPSL